MMKNAIFQRIHKNTNLQKRFFSALNSLEVVHPISFRESKINKNAVILENEHYSSKIIFPDYKADIELNIGNKEYTIKNLLDDSRKKLEKEFILSLVFMDEEGNIIANSVQASMLARMSVFRIVINGGERIYNCVNPSYLGNKKLEKEVVASSKDINFRELERLVFREKLSFSTAMSLLKNNENNISVKYSSILKEYLHNKYSLIREYSQTIREQREKRIQRFVNLFFYMCLTQTVALNLCTFIFFNWDFMEPITLLISYLNIIAGYYFWAITDTSYDMESMIQWLRTRGYLTEPARTDAMLREKEEISRLLEQDFSRL